MANKLVVIIYILKVPKIKKILLYEMKFLVPNYSCLQNPWLGGYGPQIPVHSVLFPQLNFWTPPPNNIPGYATDSQYCTFTVPPTLNYILLATGGGRLRSPCIWDSCEIIGTQYIDLKCANNGRTTIKFDKQARFVSRNTFCAALQNQHLSKFLCHSDHNAVQALCCSLLSVTET